MRKRLFDKKVKKMNLVTSVIDSPDVTAAILNATSASATNLTVDTILRLPSTPHASSAELTAADYGTFYFTGLQLYIAKSGTWISGTLGVG